MSEKVGEIVSDTVFGAAAIAAFVGLDERQVYRLASKGLLPGAFRMGKSLALLKSVYAAEIRARATRTVQAG